MKKVLYCASTAGHLVSFHIPYMTRMQSDGWVVHGGGAGTSDKLSFLDGWVDMPFEKSITSVGNFSVARSIARKIREGKYDLILVHTSLAAFFVRLALKMAGKGNTRLVNTVHGYLFDGETPLMKRTMLLTAEKLTTSVTDRVLTMNACDYDIATKHHLSRGDIINIPGMGIDLDRFAPATSQEKAEARASFGIDQDAFVMVYAGEFSSRKNQSLLIEAMKSLPDKAVLLLPGRGDLLEQCRDTASVYGNRVILPGFMADVERAYAAADICVSASRSEGLPFNIMEAMARGLPVVATAVKGHTDLVTDGANGWAFCNGDGDEFACRVLELMEYPQLLAPASVKARATAEQYALKNVYDTVYKAMTEVV